MQDVDNTGSAQTTYVIACEILINICSETVYSLKLNQLSELSAILAIRPCNSRNKNVQFSQSDHK